MRETKGPRQKQDELRRELMETLGDWEFLRGEDFARACMLCGVNPGTWRTASAKRLRKIVLALDRIALEARRRDAEAAKPKPFVNQRSTFY